MLRRAFLIATSCFLLSVPARAGKGDPKQIEPLRRIQPPQDEGYFDDVFGMDAEAKRIAAVRTNGATFSKLEVFDASTGKVATSFDLPSQTLLPYRIELGPEGKGLVLVAREKPDDLAPLFAFAFDAAGKQVAKVGPAVAFGRPPADGSARAGWLVAYDRKAGAKGAEATYTISPFDATTLAPAGKPRVHKVDVAGELKGLGLRFIGFFDGYTKILAERPGAYDKAADMRAPPRMAIVDALSGKVVKEGEITDLVGWAVTGQLRRNNPGRALFVDLNQDASGVDVVDAMGKKQPAALAVPFHMYDIKSLLSEEGPGPGVLTFGLAVDPLNPDAIKRQKADLPMLDVYTADAASGTVKHRGRVFIPRPVTWRTRGDRLVVLKRFKSFSRGGDELQVYDLR
jgi:hypothetical protein